MSTGLLLVILWSNGVERGGPFTLMLEGVRRRFTLNIFDIFSGLRVNREIEKENKLARKWSIY